MFFLKLIVPCPDWSAFPTISVFLFHIFKYSLSPRARVTQHNTSYITARIHLLLHRKRSLLPTVPLIYTLPCSGKSCVAAWCKGDIAAMQQEPRWGDTVWVADRGAHGVSGSWVMAGQRWEGAGYLLPFPFPWHPSRASMGLSTLRHSSPVWGKSTRAVLSGKPSCLFWRWLRYCKLL